MEKHQEVIVVHTIGKVASSTIYKAAKAFGDTPVYHTHFLDPVRLKNASAKLAKHGKILHGHVKDSVEVLSLIEEDSVRLKVITLIRNPVARDVSAFFENLEMFGFDKNDLPPVDIACDKFLESFQSSTLDDWFDKEFVSVFGVNVLDQPFPRRLGWYCFEKENIDFLILKAELLNNVKEAVVGAFLGCPGLIIGSENVMADKFDPEYYSAFKVRLAGNFGIRIKSFESDYCRHFYTSEELSEFKRRWSSSK